MRWLIDGLPAGTAPVVAASQWLAVVLGLYAAGLNVLAALAARSADPRWERALRRLGPGPLRRWCTGLALAGASTAAVGSAVPGPTPPPSIATAAAPIPTSPRLDPAVDERPAPPISVAPAPATPTVEPASPAGPLSYTLRPGDHLWSVAERAVHLALGREPAEADVDRYWRRLVEANRDVLVDPSEPDLVFPGQVVALPPLADAEL